MTELTPFDDLSLATEDDSAIRAQLLAFVRDKDAFSANTWTQLMSVMRMAARWSREHNCAFLPMSPHDLREYLLFLQRSGRASSTVSTHAALISMLHRNAGLTPPTVSPLVCRTMKKINRNAVLAGERAGQAIPFRIGDLLALDGKWASSPRLQHARDLAFLHVAYATLLRISELGRLRVRDVTHAADGRIVLDVGWTKTLVMTGGLIKGLGALSSERLTAWLKVSGLIQTPDAFLFAPVHRSNRALAVTDKPLSTRALEDIFARAWREAGPQAAQANKNRYRGWTGHSTRVGAAIDMAKNRYSLAQIMQEGTWKKTETLMRYIRHVDAHAGAMVDLMARYA